jgi:hypothetical protein
MAARTWLACTGQVMRNMVGHGGIIMKRKLSLAASLVLPIPLMFVACGRIGSYSYLIQAVIQLLLFMLAVMCDRTWWAAFAMGLLGIMCGHTARIMYDTVYHLYDHNLFPIELTVSAVMAFIFMIPGMLFALIIRSSSEKGKDAR